MNNGGNVKFSLDRNALLAVLRVGDYNIEKGGTGVSTVTPRQALLGPTGTTSLTHRVGG